MHIILLVLVRWTPNVAKVTLLSSFHLDFRWWLCCRGASDSAIRWQVLQSFGKACRGGHQSLRIWHRFYFVGERPRYVFGRYHRGHVIMDGKLACFAFISVSRSCARMSGYIMGWFSAIHKGHNGPSWIDNVETGDQIAAVSAAVVGAM